MNKLLSILKIVTVGFLFSSCVKNADHFTDFSTAQPVLEMKTALKIANGSADYTNIAGLPNFGSAALSGISSYFPNDTISFYVNLASDYPLDHDLTIKVGINVDALTAYNSDTINNTVQYEVMPDSDYVWTDQTVTIPAGQRTVLVSGLSFNYDKIDGSKNYMLPIGVIDGNGVNVSANMGTIYFHAIGNPLAGAYTYSTTDPPFRYAYSGTIIYNYPGPIPVGYTALDLTQYYPKIASPDDATTIEIPCANGFANYVISFDPDTYEITDVSLNPSNTTSNFLVYYANYDVASKTFHLVIHYNNVADPAGSGDDRIVDETLIKQ